MEVSATAKGIRISPYKVRLLADQIRGKDVATAMNLLNFSTRAASVPVRKLLESAIANAENNAGADVDELWIRTIFVNEGPTLKRMKPRAKGRADRILKRSCHITVAVTDGHDDTQQTGA